MRPIARRPPRAVLWIAGAILAGVGALTVFYLRIAPSIVARRIRAAAATRDLEASWDRLAVRPPLRIVLQGLVGVGAHGDTAVRVRSLDLEIDPGSLLSRPPRVSRLMLVDAQLELLPGERAADDSLASERPVSGKKPRPDHLPRLRRAGSAVVRGLLRATERLPRVSLSEIDVSARDPELGVLPIARVADLEVRAEAGSAASLLDGHGVVWLEDAVPFSARLRHERDGGLEGRLDLEMTGAAHPETLSIYLWGKLRRDRAGVALAEGSRLTVGSVPFDVSGLLEPEGPRVAASLSAHGIRPTDVKRSIPATLLGPLARLSLLGAFDYALSFDIDLAHADSLKFRADVTPRALSLDRWDELELLRLSGPFTAVVRLPRGRLVVRDLSPLNRHFRPLETIDSTLVHAVVTNEDGGFYRHRGFNVEAMKEALVENLHAGTYRRGAGTITMQLVRNLYLGHDRTLARKAQEVVLAWLVEHLASASKQRLLEIYLNIIEWGPGVHGADEAAFYYYGHDAGTMSVPEALLLATIVPAPTKWRYRFDANGTLRPFARAQMHFIGRAMAARGRLDPSRLPAADSLSVTLAGPARDVLFPRGDSSRAQPDSAVTDSASKRHAPASTD